MSFDVVAREGLDHNPANAVTAVVERVSDTHGRTRVRKQLLAPTSGAAADDDARWAASSEPSHWNFWRREADVYRDPAVRESLTGTWLGMPDAEVSVDEGGATLLLEDVAGTPGETFTLDDHGAIATGLGRWQARGPWQAPWASRAFLRTYSTTRAVPLDLVDDDDAWAQPLVADLWPSGLRAGWTRLLAHREDLLIAVETLPRTRYHLDAWVLNEIRRPTGEVVLLD